MAQEDHHGLISKKWDLRPMGCLHMSVLHQGHWSVTKHAVRHFCTTGKLLARGPASVNMGLSHWRKDAESFQQQESCSGQGGGQEGEELGGEGEEQTR